MAATVCDGRRPHAGVLMFFVNLPAYRRSARPFGPAAAGDCCSRQVCGESRERSIGKDDERPRSPKGDGRAAGSHETCGFIGERVLGRRRDRRDSWTGTVRVGTAGRGSGASNRQARRGCRIRYLEGGCGPGTLVPPPACTRAVIRANTFSRRMHAQRTHCGAGAAARRCPPREP